MSTRKKIPLINVTIGHQVSCLFSKELDNSRFTGIIFMDFSKAYDCLPHDLLSPKEVFKGYLNLK